MDITLRNQTGGEERFLGHAIVALSIDRRNVPLVTEEYLHALPIDVSAFALSEQFVQPLGSGATGESNRAEGLVLQACLKDAADSVCRAEEEIAGGGEHFESAAGLDFAIDRLRRLRTHER